MAEYIDKAKVDYEFITTRGGGDVITNLYERILDIPSADVIERSKIDRAIEEIKQNAYPIVHGVNNHDIGMTLNGILQVLEKNIGE